MTAAAVVVRLRADMDAFVVPLDAARLRLEPTPIWDDLIAQHGAAIVAAADDVVQAVADLHRHTGGAW